MDSQRKMLLIVFSAALAGALLYFAWAFANAVVGGTRH
jgi:hypothetical protein